MNTRTILLAAIAATLPLTAGAATVFADRDGFNAAAGPLSTEMFDNVIRSGRAITFDNGTVSTRVGGATANQVNNGRFLGTVVAEDKRVPEKLTFDFAEGTTAFGADFGALGEPFTRTGPSLFLTGLFDGILQTFSIGDVTGENGFFGLTSSTAFSSVTFTTQNPSFVGRENFNLDNLALSDNTPVVAPVPLPAGLPLLVGALGIFGFAKRRRAAKKA